MGNLPTDAAQAADNEATLQALEGIKRLGELADRVIALTARYDELAESTSAREQQISALAERVSVLEAEEEVEGA